MEIVMGMRSDRDDRYDYRFFRIVEGVLTAYM